MKLFSGLKLFVLLGFVLFIVSCGGGSASSVVQKDFKQGVGEIEIDFFENAPPRDVFQKSEFKIVPIIKNEMGYDASDMSVKIVGLPEEFYNLVRTYEDNIFLEGQSLTNPAGGRYIGEFGVQSGKLFLSAKERRDDFFVKVSYKSSIDFSETLCINPNLYDINDAGCKIEGRKSYSGQGAPLAVDKLEGIMSPGANPVIEIRLKLKNKGDGEVGQVSLTNSKIGGKEVVCGFDNAGIENKEFKFTRDEREALLICKMPVESSQSYSTTFYLSFDYDYSFKVKRQIRLKSGFD
jgi:hypothetical protein